MTARSYPSQFGLRWFALAALAPLVVGCHKVEHSRAVESLPTQSVRVMLAEENAHPLLEDVVGTVRAKLRAAIEAKVSARIERLLVDPGQIVKADDLIAQLDAREIQAKLDQALAVREQAVRELKRAQDLKAGNITTQAEFDTAQARERVAVGAVREMETLLGYTKLLAPFAGVVTRKLADVGDLAAPGKPVVEMEDPTVLRFEADVPESLIGSIKLGDTYSVRVGNATQLIPGKVAEMAPVADAASRTFLVALDLPPSAAARSGQFGRVSIGIGESRAIWVPASALLVRGQIEAVFVAVGGRAQLRLVRTGKRVQDQVELLSGVSKGESIVVDGVAALRDAQPITIKP